MAGPTNHSFLENVWLFGLGTPGLPKKHLAQQTLRDPSDIVIEADFAFGCEPAVPHVYDPGSQRGGRLKGLSNMF